MHLEHVKARKTWPATLHACTKRVLTNITPSRWSRGEQRGVLKVFFRATHPRSPARPPFCTSIEQLKNAELMAAFENSVWTMANLLEMPDQETEGHSLRVADQTSVWPERRNFGEAIRYIRWAAMLHDIGKIIISDSVLKKRASLPTRSGWRS